jgi:hypothetical protein
MRLSNSNLPGAKSLAQHPDASTGLMIRIHGDDVMIVWRDGSRTMPIRDVPTSWRCPADDAGRSLRVKIKRPTLASMLGYQVIDVEFE